MFVIELDFKLKRTTTTKNSTAFFNSGRHKERYFISWIPKITSYILCKWDKSNRLIAAAILSSSWSSSSFLVIWRNLLIRPDTRLGQLFIFCSLCSFLFDITLLKVYNYSYQTDNVHLNIRLAIQHGAPCQNLNILDASFRHENMNWMGKC